MHLTRGSRALTIAIMVVEQLELWNRSQSERNASTASASGGRRAQGKLAQLDPQLASPRLHLADELDQLEASVQQYIVRATAASTRHVYQAGWSRFERWCAKHGRVALPALPETIAMYVADLANTGRAYSSLRHNLFAIAKVHVASGSGRPDRDDRVRVVLRGIGRSIGTRAEGACPIGPDELTRLVAALGVSSRDLRDRAILLLGFAGAYRSSDVATLNVEHIRFTTQGMDVLLARSKEDQMGRGRTTSIPADVHPTLCPVEAVRLWLAAASAATGPLFRVIKGTRISAERIHPRAVSRAVQRAANKAGLGAHYSSHSLRRGFATAAHARGSSLRAIQVHGGWTYMSSLARYIDLPERESSRQVVSRVLRASETAAG